MNKVCDKLILGAGLAGLSVSYHSGHAQCLLLEKNLFRFGHLHVDFREGFTWDQGPHVSFTKHDYVKRLFEKSIGSDGFDEYSVLTSNYYNGGWIAHPAQCSLHQISEPLRSLCLRDFLESRGAVETAPSPVDYADWLEKAFGSVFAETFPFAYTRKFWTREPHELGVDWVGSRVFKPDIEDVIAGSKGPLKKSTHYITKVRYPKTGGYQAFADGLAEGANVEYGADVSRISLAHRKVWTRSGIEYSYEQLVSTVPLPVFIGMCSEVPDKVRAAAMALDCSRLLLVNVMAPHPTRRTENWMYVYDEAMYSTRINCTEKLTAGNAPDGHTGVQVEVYYGRGKPLPASPEEIAGKVKIELVQMGIIDGEALAAGKVRHTIAHAPWANVIFDHATRPALDMIWSWLEGYGLVREEDDLHPLTDWAQPRSGNPGKIMFAGRFGQWKYFWTDDCVLRGKEIGEKFSTK